MSQEGILFRIFDRFIGSEIQMVDFLGQFMYLAKKNFEPGKIYNLQEFCFVKRKPSDSGTGEILQFFDEKLEVIEEVELEDRATERLMVNEFLSFEGDGQEAFEIDITPKVNDFFNDILSLNDPGFIKKRGGRLSRILLEEDRKGERYTDRPDIPLFEDSEDGFQKVNPISKAFEEEEDLAIKSSFDDEPDLFSDLGLNSEKDHEEPIKPDFLNAAEEPEVVFTHSSLVIPEDEEEDDEESYSIFSGGMKVTPVTEEDETSKMDVTDQFEVDNFLESLVALPETVEEIEVYNPEVNELSEFSNENFIETEKISEVEGEIHVSDIMVETREEISESDIVVEIIEKIPESEEIAEIIPEIAPSEDTQTDSAETIEEFPQKKQRISIFDDIVDLTSVSVDEVVGQESLTINVENLESENESFEKTSDPIKEIIEPESEPENIEELAVEPMEEVTEPESEPENIEELAAESVEEVTEPESEPENIEELAAESVEEVTEPESEPENIEEMATEPVEEVTEPESEPENIEELAAESVEEVTEPESEPENIEEMATEPVEEVTEPEAEMKTGDEIVPDTEEPDETEPEEDKLMFDESMFDGVIDIPEEFDSPIKDGEDPIDSESTETFEKVEPISIQVEPVSVTKLSHISAEEVVHEAEEPLSFNHLDEYGELANQDSEEMVEDQNITMPPLKEEPTNTESIKAESQEMEKESEPPKSQLSVLIRMLIVLAVIIATYFILQASGLLRGKNAVQTETNLAQGALVIVDSNLLADNREYPFNKDTQNDVNIKGAVFKDGRYFEVEENGTLNPILYDSSTEKTYKVFVPVDSAAIKEEKKAKKDVSEKKDANKKASEKSEDNTKNGNITLQDAVKNKVKETKIADFIFKSGKKYFVQTSAHRAFDTAEKLAKDLKKKGYKSFVMKIKKSGVAGEEGVWYRVRVGPFDKEEKAREVNNTLNPQKKK